MFPTRSRLQHVDCPDHLNGICQRPSCPFAHRASRRQEVEEVEAAPGSLKRKAPAVNTNDGASKRQQTNPELKQLLSVLSAGPRNAYTGKKEQPSSEAKVSTMATASTSSPVKPPATTRTVEVKPKSTPASSLQSTLNSNNLLTAPSLSRSLHPGSSPVPLASRQSSLSTLFTTFHSLYSSIAPRANVTNANYEVNELLVRLAHQFASKDASASENKVFKNSNVNFLAYKNSIRTSLVGLKKRQKADNEAEEKGEKRCLCMLGIEAGEMVDSLKKESVKEAGIDQRIEDAIVKMFNESTLIGTAEEVEQKNKMEEERIKGRLDLNRLNSADLLTDRATLEFVGYPIPPDWKEGDKSLKLSIEESWGEGGRQPSLEGTLKTCDRCGTSFTVSNLDTVEAHEREACSYHWGKRRYVREANVAKGPRLPRWTCCDALDEATTYASNSLSQLAVSAGIVESTQGQVSAPRGCTIGPHVFKEEASELLHQREGFLSSEEICSRDNIRDRNTHEVLAFDCELIYTTAGMSLARLTVLDEAGKVIMDQYIKPKTAVLDYNTRYSGIKEPDMQLESIVDLPQARKMMAEFMTPETVLVGHGLENDLKALRLVHLQVADSALIYKHRKGLPFRLSLRELTLTQMGKKIQVEDASLGHDPEEDARAALDLVRRQYVENINRNTTAPSVASTASNAMYPSSIVRAATTQRPVTSASKPMTTTASGPSAAATASLFIKKREPMRKKSK